MSSSSSVVDGKVFYRGSDETLIRLRISRDQLFNFQQIVSEPFLLVNVIVESIFGLIL